MFDWKMLATHSPRPMAGTSTTSSFGISFFSALAAITPCKQATDVHAISKAPAQAAKRSVVQCARADRPPVAAVSFRHATHSNQRLSFILAAILSLIHAFVLAIPADARPRRYFAAVSRTGSRQHIAKPSSPQMKRLGSLAPTRSWRRDSIAFEYPLKDNCGEWRNRRRRNRRWSSGRSDRSYLMRISFGRSLEASISRMAWRTASAFCRLRFLGKSGSPSAKSAAIRSSSGTKTLACAP